MEEPIKAQLSLVGRLRQFNCTVALLLLAILVAFYFVLQITEPFIRNTGACVTGISFVAVIGFVIWYYTKQASRPVDAEPSQVVVESGDKKLVLHNPPDKFFEPVELQAAMRAVLVGYDDNLCPDAQVVGKAADGQERPYTPQEQKEFVAAHQRRIRQFRAQAAATIVEGKPELKPLVERITDADLTPGGQTSDSGA